MNHHTAENPVIVGLSLQWPFDAMRGVAGPVSLIQVAYDNMVYLIQVGRVILWDISMAVSLLHILPDQGLHARWWSSVAPRSSCLPTIQLLSQGWG